MALYIDNIDPGPMARKKISRSLSAITWVVMLFVLVCIFSGAETRSTSWADYGKKVNDSSTVPTPIKISSGQILSRALLLDPSLLLAAKEAAKNDDINDPETNLNRTIAFPG